jgi:hypothetical protein
MVHDSPATLDEALDIVPKVELHCHIEGAMRRATVVDLAARRSGPLSDLLTPPERRPGPESNILGKLGASGRTEAAAIAHRLGLVD